MTASPPVPTKSQVAPVPATLSPLQRMAQTVSVLAMVLGASLGVSQAQASQVTWSVGIATPGAVVHVASPVPRVVYHQAPVQVVVPPVVVAPHWAPPRSQWYGPYAGLGHHRHHRDRYDEHRWGPRHGHGHRGQSASR